MRRCQYCCMARPLWRAVQRAGDTPVMHLSFRPLRANLAAGLRVLILVLAGCSNGASLQAEADRPGRDLSVLYRLLVDPTTEGTVRSGEVDDPLVLAVADLLARVDIGSDRISAVYGLVSALGGPVVAEEPWADAESRRRLANRELETLLDERYDVFLQEVSGLWQRAEPCLPSCTESDLYEGGQRPLGRTEQAVAAACPEPQSRTSPARPEPHPPGGMGVEVRLGRLPRGVQQVEELPLLRGVAGQYDPSPGGSGRAVQQQLLAVGDPATTTEYVQITTVVDARVHHCATLAVAARAADRRGDESGPITVDGEVGVLHAPSDVVDSGLLLWVATEEVMVQLLSRGATAAQLQDIADAVEVTVTGLDSDAPPRG